MGAPHNTAQAATCSLWKEREPGSLELDAMEQYAMRTPSPLLRIAVGETVGRGHCSAPEETMAAGEPGHVELRTDHGNC